MTQFSIMMFFDACTNKDNIAAYARRGNVKKMKKILESGVDPNTSDRDGYIPICEAIEGDHVNAIKLLIQYGADVYISSPNVGTCLHLAVFNNSFRSAKYLIQNTNLRSWIKRKRDGNTPMHDAVSKNQFKMVSMFYNIGGVVNRGDECKNNKGITPLMLATKAGNVNMMACFEKSKPISIPGAKYRRFYMFDD